MKPEVQTLLEEYRKTQLHQRRPGRAYDNVDTDNFRRGMNKLRNGKLAKWIIDTTTTRGLNTVTALPPLGVADEQDIASVEEYEVGEDEDEDEGSDDAVEQADYQSKISDSVTMGFMQMVNGELIIHTADFDEVDDLFTELEADAEEED
jgi:ethanolamine utilization protein EutQ (cupin superfamily)